MLPPFTSAMSRPRGIKGGAKYKANQVWCIEGEYVTTQEIADRDGRSYSSIKPIMAKLRRSAEPVTWQLIKDTKRG